MVWRVKNWDCDENEKEKTQVQYNNHALPIKPVLSVLMFLVTLIAVPLLAQSDETLSIGPKGEVTFETPVRVGKVLLHPGNYQVQHATEGQDDVVYFRRSEGARAESSSAAGPQVVRVKCRLTPLSTPANSTVLHYGLRKNHKQLLYLLVQGDNMKHHF